MNESSWIGIIGRVFVWTSVGFALSLLVGTLFSLLPASPVEALHGGVIVTGSLLVLVYFLALKFRGSDRRRSWVFDLHSVLGLATGILLSVIFVTGVLLLYRAEIEAFSNPWLEVSQGTHYASVDEWLGAVDSRTDLNSTNRIDITWPARKDHSIRISTQGTSGFELFYVDPYNAKIIDGQLKSQMGLIRRLHVGLNLGAPGHWVAGLVSLLAIWLCISGLSMGRNVFSEWYLVRWRHGLRRFLSDVHKRIGLWFLPFIAINAFAGMIAAFFSVFTIGPVETRFEGSNAALYEAIGSPQSIDRGGAYELPSMDDYIGAARKIMPEAEIRSMRILGYGDRNAIVGIRASRTGDLAPNGTSLVLNIRASTGEIVVERELAKSGPFERISMALAAFHFAQYGGSVIRPIHAITALAISLIPALGMAMWFFRRQKRGFRPPRLSRK